MSDLQCEMPQYNPPSEEIRAILEKYKTVAIGKSWGHPLVLQF